jgi:hypothetical protein
MIIRSLFALALLATPSLAGDEPEITGREFVMPSGNIACMVEDINGGSRQLYCVRNLPKTIVVTLSRNGIESFPTSGDQPVSFDAEVLQYGDNFYNSGFSCDSSESGLLCSHNKWGGFELSRKGLTRFD